MVRASGIRGYAALMRSLRADPCALLARYGIDAHELDDDENLLSLRSVIHLLEESAALTGCGDFGLRLAERQDVNILGPFGILLQSAETIRDAMHYGSRFMFVHSPGLASTLHDPSEMVTDAVELAVDCQLDRVIFIAAPQEIGVKRVRALAVSDAGLGCLKRTTGTCCAWRPRRCWPPPPSRRASVGWAGSSSTC